MRIDHVLAQNILGVNLIDLELDTPVTLFAGGNRQGKSSLCESIRMALGENPIRVSLKKDFSMLVKEGAKTGRASVSIAGADSAITLPKGDRSGSDGAPSYADTPALPFVLDPARFAALDTDARRTFLFALTGCHASGKVVSDMLAKRGCSSELVAEVLPMLRSGFPAACDAAKGHARDAKAAWKAITNEAYGDKKAEDWEADVPAFDQKRLASIGAELDSVQSSSEQAATLLGALSEKAKAHARWKQSASTRQQEVDSLPGLRKKLEFDQGELAKWEKEIQRLEGLAGTGPREGLVHDLARELSGVLDSLPQSDSFLDGAYAALRGAYAALRAYEDEYGPLGASGDPDAADKLGKATQARDLMARAVANTNRDIGRIESIEQAEDEPEAVAQESIEQAEDELARLRGARQELDDERRRLDALSTAAQQAADKTKRAAAEYANVQAWLKIADALAPDGIPGELLSQALAPVNARLRQSSIDTGWRQVAIGADMQITADGRLYQLLSASEKWRADAMLGEAISHLSGLRLLLLDGMDILEVSARSELLQWLDGLAYARQIDTALVFATLKSVPTGLPETMRGHWIHAGSLAEAEALAS
ncbi:AAA family ATPase [Parapusillimonas sp. JC17]|uniref:AAA family ATPase n=1 Tax=Parapusillimonas sp. JC17 TaxID=3445768 RepID=UPI003F9FF669